MNMMSSNIPLYATTCPTEQNRTALYKALQYIQLQSNIFGQYLGEYTKSVLLTRGMYLLSVQFDMVYVN